MQNKVQTTVIFSGVIAASGTAQTNAHNMENWNPTGAFSLHVQVSGNGTLKIDPYCSNLSSAGQAIGLLVPDGAASFKTGLTKTSGPGSDGNIFLPSSVVQFPISKWNALLLTETGGANTVTVTITMTFQ